MKIHNPSEVDSEILHRGEVHILKAGESTDKSAELCRHWQSVHEFLEIAEEKEAVTTKVTKKVLESKDSIEEVEAVEEVEETVTKKAKK